MTQQRLNAAYIFIATRLQEIKTTIYPPIKIAMLEEPLNHDLVGLVHVLQGSGVATSKKEYF